MVSQKRIGEIKITFVSMEGVGKGFNEKLIKKNKISK